jgi:DNA repair protein RadD
MNDRERNVVILRSYQEQDIATIRALFQQGARTVCYCGATGSGKTIMFCHAAHKAMEKGQRVLIVVHRQELIDQTVAALAIEGVPFGIIASGYRENLQAPVQVAMVQSLVNRLDRLRDVRLLVVDECHHVLAQTWRTIVDALPNALVLGVTATPERLDGKGLGEVFSALVIGPSVKNLIDARWLSPFVIFAPEHTVDLKRVRSVAGDYALNDLTQRMNTDVVLGDVVTEFGKHLLGRTALAFCVTIAHSRATARFLRAHGIRTEHLDGDTPGAERREIIARLARGETDVVCNCGIISEGLDIPSVGGVILLRPTKSVGLHLQQVGRALRPSEGKDRAVILDHSGNTYKHGFPDLEHAWSLNGRPKQRRSAPVKRCPNCGALIAASAKVCPECSVALPTKPAPIPVSTPLVEITPADGFERWLAHGQFSAVTEWAGTNEARLHQVARARGYQPGWVYYRLRYTREADDNALMEAVWK